MKIFVSEYVCGGAWPDGDAPVSLLREGRAMLRGIVEDFARVSGCQVVTTLAVEQQPLDVRHVDVVRVITAAEEADVFQRCAAESDACLIIAPELDNVLYTRCEAAQRAGAPRLLNPASDVVGLCSDKLHLFQFLIEHDIPTIPTVAWPPDSPFDLNGSRVVIKPRFGAGSQEIQVCDSVASARAQQSNTANADQWIAQQLIHGTAVSVGVLCDSHNGVHEELPVAAQYLSDDGRFYYLGGRIPWGGSRSDEVQHLVRRTCRALPGLAGYVGFDFVVPFDDSEPPVVVEINPRLCTSYLGYRVLAEDNLAARLLRPSEFDAPIRWKSGSVRFHPDGRAERNSAMSAAALMTGQSHVPASQ